MRGFAAIALLALAGCVPPGAPGNDSRTNRPAPAPAPAPSPVAASPLVGRWADAGASCTNAVEIFGNGVFRAVDGSRGHWRVEGDRLRINVGERVYNFQLVSVTRDRIDVIDGNGQRGASVRCP
jgi:hypothetical protein